MENIKAKVLIVDDSELNRMMLKEMLGEEYEVLEAVSGEMALNMIWEHGQELSLILLDIVMPGMSGFDVLNHMNREKWMIRSIPVIVVSAEQDSKTLNRAFESGAVDFIPRPFNGVLVKRRIQNTIMLFAKQKQLEGMVADEIYENMKRSSLLIMVLSHIVEFRNKESGLHVVNISTITHALLKQLRVMNEKYRGLSDSEITDISIAASLHDIGKITIPEQILNKPGRLTAEEFAVMKTHAMEGARLLDEIPFGKDDNLMKISYQICRWHHERYDGSGYPDGLKGDEIPLSAQVVGIADVYDALTSKRVYKPPYSSEQAARMIEQGECGQFSPDVLAAFHEIVDQLPEIIASKEEEINVRDDAGRITRERYEDLEIDNAKRTMRQLEYEQNKAQFYASITHDVLFDYSINPPMVSISAHGCHKYGLPSAIYHPEKNERLLKVISRKDMETLVNRAKGLAHENIRVRMEVELTLPCGRKEWNRIIVRPVYSREHGGAFSGMLGVVTNINTDYKQFLLMSEKATVDGMTNLLNQTTIRATIEKELRESPEESRFGLMVLDVDNLKQVNDSMGHSAGDDYLKLIASQMRRSTRSGDLTGRIGGDEFVIFFRYDRDPALTAERIYERIMNLSGMRESHEDSGRWSEEFEASVSAGFATVESVGREYQSLFAAADRALYEVKRHGKNHCLEYCSEMEPLEEQSI